jgi:SAM-dependent methyltransferase
LTRSGSDAYAENAAFWVQIIRQRLDRYRTELTDEAVLAAIGEVHGNRLLDGGCGEGYLSRILTTRGAVVTGLDKSSALIAAARDERDRLGLNITYHVGSLDNIPEEDETFDVVVCNHVMNDIENPAAVLKEIGRVTKGGGRLILLMLHPCFYTAGAERQVSDSIPIKAYFDMRQISVRLEVAGLGSPDLVHMTLYSLERYISMIVDSGYVITQVAEPHPTSEQLDDGWWRANFVKPLFLLVVAERTTLTM